MTLGEFLNHIKHKSIKIRITTLYYDDRKGCLRFEGTLGEYQTSVVKSEINNKSVEVVLTKTDGLDILIKEDVNE